MNLFNPQNIKALSAFRLTLSSRDLGGIISLVFIFALIILIVILFRNFRSMKYVEDRESFTFSSMLKNPGKIYFKDIEKVKVVYSKHYEAYLKIKTFDKRTVYLRMKAFDMNNLKTYLELNTEADFYKSMRYVDLVEPRMDLPTVVYIGSRALAGASHYVGRDTFSIYLTENPKEFVDRINEFISLEEWSAYPGKFDTSVDGNNLRLTVYDRTNDDSVIALEYNEKLDKMLVSFVPDWTLRIKSYPYLYIK